MESKKLTDKQKRFCEEYVLSDKGNYNKKETLKYLEKINNNKIDIEFLKDGISNCGGKKAAILLMKQVFGNNHKPLFDAFWSACNVLDRSLN